MGLQGGAGYGEGECLPGVVRSSQLLAALLNQAVADSSGLWLEWGKLGRSVITFCRE
jgi:hypothetical protein